MTLPKFERSYFGSKRSNLSSQSLNTLAAVGTVVSLFKAAVAPLNTSNSMLPNFIDYTCVVHHTRLD